MVIAPKLSEALLAPKEMSEKGLRAVLWRIGLAIPPVIKNRSAVLREALEAKKLEWEKETSARLQVRHLNPRGKTKSVLCLQKQLPTQHVDSLCPCDDSFTEHTQWSWASLQGQRLQATGCVTALPSLVAPAVNLIRNHVAIKLQMYVCAKHSLTVFKVPLQCCPELENQEFNPKIYPGSPALTKNFSVAVF